jgi:hypothetical protein
MGAPLNGLSLATFAKQFGSASGDKWDFHNEYEKAVADRCYAELLPRWRDRLADTSTYLRDNYWVMMESAIVILPLQSTATGACFKTGDNRLK